MLLLNIPIVAYLEIKHCLFHLYVMCICYVYLCSNFLMTNKLNNDKDFYLHLLWPKYPPYFLKYFVTFKGFVFMIGELVCL